jgi:hypothetical protein
MLSLSKHDIAIPRLYLRSCAVAIIAVVTAFPLANGNAVAAPGATSTMLPTHVGVDPHIEAKAKEWFFRFQRGDIDRAQLNEQVNATLTTEMIRAESAKLRPLGAPASFAFVSSEPVHGAMGYDFLLDFGRTRIVESIAFDSDGKIAGIDFQTFVRQEEH